MTLLCLVYLICALRTNIVFVVIFFTLILTLGMVTGAYWVLASDYVGNAALAAKLLVVSNFARLLSWRDIHHSNAKC